jgi:hypothetical protein
MIDKTQEYRKSTGIPEFGRVKTSADGNAQARAPLPGRGAAGQPHSPRTGGEPARGGNPVDIKSPDIHRESAEIRRNWAGGKSAENRSGRICASPPDNDRSKAAGNSAGRNPPGIGSAENRRKYRADKSRGPAKSGRRIPAAKVRRGPERGPGAKPSGEALFFGECRRSIGRESGGGGGRRRGGLGVWGRVGDGVVGSSDVVRVLASMREGRACMVRFDGG